MKIIESFEISSKQDDDVLNLAIDDTGNLFIGVWQGRNGVRFKLKARLVLDDLNAVMARLEAEKEEK